MSIKPIRVSVCGAMGKMGERIFRCIQEEKDLIVSGAVERGGHPQCGKDIGMLLGGEPLNVVLTDNMDACLAKSDVVIDFTSREAAMKNVNMAVRHRVAMVIGTTGLTSEDEKTIYEAASEIPIVKAPNMSVGVNLLYKLVAEAAKGLGDGYDVEIVETHHRFKKDAPSGTALQLARVVAEALGHEPEKGYVYGRQGDVGARKSGQIGVFAVRSGDVVGEHTVVFGGIGERVELTHRAHTRDTFARGAIRAARFAAGHSPGLYSMMDVLGM